MNPLEDANAIYQPAVQAAQAQAPAIAQLYQSLTQGLQNQANQGQVSIADWAARAGVASPMLNQQIGANLQGEAGLQSAIVGAEAARGQANLGQQIGGINVDKAGAIQALSQSLAQEQRQNQMNQYEMSNIERQAQLDQTKNQRSYDIEVAQRQAAAAAAASAAKASFSELSKSDIERGLRIKLNAVRGKDGHVSPENLANAYKIWKEAGLKGPDFWSNYKGLWNSKQKTYADEFKYYGGGS